LANSNDSELREPFSQDIFHWLYLTAPWNVVIRSMKVLFREGCELLIHGPLISPRPKLAAFLRRRKKTGTSLTAVKIGRMCEAEQGEVSRTFETRGFYCETTELHGEASFSNP